MCKLFHLTWSYKAMILLYYSLFLMIGDLIEKLLIGDAKLNIVDYGSDNCDLSDPFCNPAALGEGYCPNGDDGDVWILCTETAESNPIFTILYAVVGLSCIYALCVMVYIFIKSPKFGTLEYYAYLVMTKRARFFKIFIKVMYGIIVVIFLLFISVFIIYYALTASNAGEGRILPDIIGTAVSALILAGLSVSELRRTNEINFTYEIPEQKDQEFSKPIYMAKSCCCSCVTAEDLFEKLEEAVLVFSITGDNQLLKLCLKDDSDKECERVMSYYKHIFTTQMTEMVDSAEKATKAIELGTVIDSAANTLDVVSSNA